MDFPKNQFGKATQSQNTLFRTTSKRKFARKNSANARQNNPNNNQRRPSANRKYKPMVADPNQLIF